MIHDPMYQAVSCDGEGCTSGEDANAGSDRAIEREIERWGWIVRDGKHYCSIECAPAAREGGGVEE